MLDRHVRRLLTFCGLVILASTLNCGREPTAPRGAVRARLAWEPVFPPMMSQVASAAGAIAIDKVRILLHRADGTVALDTTITPVLLEEGIARELINRIQNLRKDKNFEVTDKISVKLQGNEEINLAVQNNLPYICSETLAQSFSIVNSIDAPGKDVIELTDTLTAEILLQKVNPDQAVVERSA
jgi:hypothetical protein